MTALFADGTILDALLVLIALEAAGLVAYNRVTGRGFAARTVLPYLGSGMAVLLAWRVAQGGAWWGWISLCLALSGLLHLLDLRRRNWFSSSRH